MIAGAARPPRHLHPHPEVFVVETGTAVFTAGEEELSVTGGHTSSSPAGDTLRVVSVHASPTVQQTNL